MLHNLSGIWRWGMNFHVPLKWYTAYKVLTQLCCTNETASSSFNSDKQKDRLCDVDMDIVGSKANVLMGNKQEREEIEDSNMEFSGLCSEHEGS